jgi:predicted small lipoprotein YifL
MNSGRNPHMRDLGLRRVLLCGAVCAALLAGACGKRGPLYLPDGAGAPARAGEPSVKPAPPPAENASGEPAQNK